MPTIMGMTMVRVATPLTKLPRNKIGIAIPIMIFRSEAPGLISTPVILPSREVLPTAAPTTNMDAIIMTELFTRPDHASPKSRICVTSRIIGIAMAARSIFTLLLRIRTTNITKVKRTIPI